MENTFTIADIARENKIPESTLRFYRDAFPHYIKTTGIGRNRRYLPEGVKALTTVHQLFGEGLSRDQVEDRLEELFPRTITIESESQQDRNKQLAVLSQGLMPLLVEYTETQKRLAGAIEKQTSAFAELSNRFEENRKQERKRSEKLLRMLREQKSELDRQRRENDLLKRELHRPLSFWEIITGKRRLSRPQQQPQMHVSPNPQQPKTPTPARG
jgi:DNA-binding transcriptional MerR regulator